MNTLTNIRNMPDVKNQPPRTKCMKKKFHHIDVLMGARVRSLRTQRGLSQENLGDALGLTFQQIQKYEKASNRISTSRLFQMAQAFEINMSQLVSGMEEEFEKQPFDKPTPTTTLELRSARDFRNLGHDQQVSVHRIIKILLGMKVI